MNILAILLKKTDKGLFLTNIYTHEASKAVVAVTMTTTKRDAV